jgi:hypothetical protein
MGIFKQCTQFLMLEKQSFRWCHSFGKGKTVDEKEIYNATIWLDLAGCKSVEFVADMVDAAKGRAGIVFPSSSATCTLIDFIYQDDNGHFHAFRATTHDVHSHWKRKSYSGPHWKTSAKEPDTLLHSSIMQV